MQTNGIPSLDDKMQSAWRQLFEGECGAGDEGKTVAIDDRPAVAGQHLGEGNGKGKQSDDAGPTQWQLHDKDRVSYFEGNGGPVPECGWKSGCFHGAYSE